MKHFNDWLEEFNGSDSDSWFEGQYKDIPEDMKESIVNYIEHGIEPGKFLTAVITNNLRNAVGYADRRNLPLLQLYVQWFYNVAPLGSHGDVKTMMSWMSKKRKI